MGSFELDWRGVLEILIISTLVYGIYSALKLMQGMRMMAGLVFLLLGLTVLSNLLDLEVLVWLLKSFSFLSIITLIIIFAPELRRAVAELGRYRMFGLSKGHDESMEDLVEAIQELSRRHFGALIALRRQDDLEEITETGVLLNSKLSRELILTIFHPKTALHDGGMIISGSRIEAAACVFPLTHREMKDRSVGLRHRAGLGLGEQSDAVVVIVSEETGHISLCHGNEMERNIDDSVLAERLEELLGANTKSQAMNYDPKTNVVGNSDE